MPQHNYNRETFLALCKNSGPFRTTLILDAEEFRNYNELMMQTIATGRVLLLDQAVFDESEADIRDHVTKIGQTAISTRTFTGDPMVLYFGDSKNTTTAAMAFLIVEPPKDFSAEVEDAVPMPVFLAYAVSDEGFSLCGIGSFKTDGVGLQVFRVTENADADQEVAKFICSTVFHAYAQALGLLATGTMQSAQ